MRYILSFLLLFSLILACDEAKESKPTDDKPIAPPVVTEMEQQNFELSIGFKDFNDSLGTEKKYQLKDDSLHYSKTHWGKAPLSSKFDAVQISQDQKDLLYKIILSLDLNGSYTKNYPGDQIIKHFAKFKMGKKKTYVYGGEAYVDDHIANELEHFGVFLDKLIQGKSEDFIRMAEDILD